MSGSRVTTVRRYVAYVAVVAMALLLPGRAAAEKVLATVDGWQLYSDGRAGGFLSQVNGDGYAQPQYGNDPTGNPVLIASPVGGGFKAVSDQHPVDPSNLAILNQGTINMTRVRSGFVSNTFGLGARGHLTEYTAVSAYIQIWAFAENNGRQKNLPNIPDVRQGYMKMEGPWGSLIVGRTRALFSPIPPVKTTASAPPIAIIMPPK